MIIIVGAGLTGLSTAYHLGNAEYQIFEKEEEVGGLCRSFKKMGFAFPYKKYFTENAVRFRPYLEGLQSEYSSMAVFGGYDELLRKDPILLWRLLSVAIWSENKR